MTDPAGSSQSSQMLAKLELLRSELSTDVGLCTTRDQHIRAVTRLNYLTQILSELTIRA